MGRLFRVILAEVGGLRERKKTPNPTPNPDLVESGIEMLELYNEEEGGESMSESTSIESKASTTQKRDPAFGAKNI